MPFFCPEQGRHACHGRRMTDYDDAIQKVKINMIDFENAVTTKAIPLEQFLINLSETVNPEDYLCRCNWHVDQMS